MKGKPIDAHAIPRIDRYAETGTYTGVRSTVEELFYPQQHNETPVRLHHPRLPSRKSPKKGVSVPRKGER